DGIDQDCDGKDAFVASPTPSPSPSGSGSSGSGSGTTTGSGTTGTATKATPTPSPVAAVPTPAPTAATTPTPTAAASQTTSGHQATSGATGAPRVGAVPRITFALVARRSQAPTSAEGKSKASTTRLTRATKIVVDHVPAGATVRVRCKGGRLVGCPVGRYKKTFKTGALHLVVRSLFDRSTLRAGARVEVRVTLPGAVGLATRYRVNARSRPDAETRCLAPGTDAPIAC
ncbi:MAG: hypothetical protein Q7T55_11225, partial [Solirubrobacteraceae bacterium]|nr:hypothetical protein [Solirubrobacteraceae bacterium]